jgi:hypothetical protein
MRSWGLLLVGFVLTIGVPAAGADSATSSVVEPGTVSVGLRGAVLAPFGRLDRHKMTHDVAVGGALDAEGALRLSRLGSVGLLVGGALLPGPSDLWESGSDVDRTVTSYRTAAFFELGPLARPSDLFLRAGAGYRMLVFHDGGSASAKSSTPGDRFAYTRFFDGAELLLQAGFTLTFGDLRISPGAELGVGPFWERDHSSAYGDAGLSAFASFGVRVSFDVAHLERPH